MFSHLILGLLRDGRPRHGYELMSEYRRLSGLQVNAGNFYRELSKLVTQELIAPVENPQDADPRRIPYRIAAGGRSEFDSWLLEPVSLGGEIGVWLLFADMLPAAHRERALHRLQEDLWLMNKTLLRARENLLARTRRNGAQYQPASLLLLRRIKQTTAELEFVEELRRELEAVVPGRVIVEPGGEPVR